MFSSLFVDVNLMRRAALVCLPLCSLSLAVPTPSSGQSSAQWIQAAELIGCWTREPTEEQARQDKEDGFTDTSELCLGARGGVEVFNLNGSTEYGIEGYSDLFDYSMGERLSFLSEGREDGSCLVSVTADLLELRECNGSYFRGNYIYRKVSTDDSASSLFDF